MQINSINTNLAAYSAQRNIGIASNMAAASVGKLSSGNRIQQASDDVAALSIGTSLKTGVSTLRTALLNTSQGSALLQVADGALAQVSEILQRQKSIAVQAGSGTLGSTERAFLDAEFQALTSEIDRIAGATNFNGVKLIDGALSAAAEAIASSTSATTGDLTMSFGDNIAVSDTVIINGVTLTAIASSGTAAGKQFNVGATLQETVQNLAARLQTLTTDNSLVGVSSYTDANKLALSEAKYEAVGSTLVISARTGGKLSDSFRVSSAGTATADYSSTLSGSFGGGSFNIWAATTSWDSLTDIVTNDTAATGTPFQNGDAIVATVGGVAHTLMTLTADAGTGTGSEYTLQDIINGINASSATTGFRATAVYTGSTYNIRLDYSGKDGVVLLDLGTNYHSGTYTLNGDILDDSLTAGVATGYHITTTADTDQGRAIFSVGQFELHNTNSVTVANVTTAVTTAAATAPSATTAPYQTGESIILTVNGKATTLHTFLATDGLDDIVASINAKTAQTGVMAAISGTGGAYNVRMYITDPSGGAISVTAGPSILAGTPVNADVAVTALTNPLSKTTVYGLAGGADDGLGMANTTVSGTVGDDILVDLNTTRTNLRATFTQVPSAGESIVVGDTTFYFTATTSNASPNEALVATTLEETLDNMVATINSYKANNAVGTAAHELNQLDIRRDGESLTFTSKRQENVLDLSGSTSTVVVSGTSGASVNNSGNLSNAATAFGVKVDGVTNADFVGTIQGFVATYTGTADQVDLSITVGDHTYTADNVDTTSTSAQTIRFISDEGGFFDLRFAANEVTTFSNQAGADAIAARLDAAFSGLTFAQQRNITSYEGVAGFSVNGAVTGSLYGSSFSAKLSDFNDLAIKDITVTAPQGNATDAKISITVGGKVFSSESGLTSKLGANQTYRFVYEEDPENQFIEFTTGSIAIQLDTTDKAIAFQTALEEAFGASAEQGGGALKFQVGTTSSDSLEISIGDSSTEELFSGLELNVLTSEDAAIAVDALDAAIQSVTEIRANVGALQSRFNFAAANIESAIQNQDAARGTLLDTDIAAESTNYATAQVKLQAGISVLAQANQQMQALLKLIG
jgi:flagellin